jgi:murein DD-endopeptidase MepM/ murein hydrolase activator NlpD
MTLHESVNHLIHDTRGRFARLGRQCADRAVERPGFAATVVLAAGVVFGAGVCAAAGFAEMSHLRHQASTQQAQLDATRAQAQREVNALAARLGELQAEANRLNALGERLTRTGQLADGEFDFDQPVGVGGVGATHDMPPRELRSGMDQLAMQFKASGEQLSVLESLLFNRKLDAEATPSRMPIANSYITSGFGGRADPFGGGAAFHKGIDFHAAMGDPVLAVADGVVSYAGQRSGYGNVVEIDHGNG